MEEADRIFDMLVPIIRGGKQPGSIAAISGMAGMPQDKAREALHWLVEQGWLLRWRDSDADGKAHGAWKYSLPADVYAPAAFQTAEAIQPMVHQDMIVDGRRIRWPIRPDYSERFYDLCREAGSEIMALQSKQREYGEEFLAEMIELRDNWALRIEMETGIKMANGRDQWAITKAVQSYASRAFKGMPGQ